MIDLEISNSTVKDVTFDGKEVREIWFEDNLVWKKYNFNNDDSIIIPIRKSQDPKPGLARATSQSAANKAPWKAVDGDSNTFWLSKAGTAQYATTNQWNYTLTECNITKLTKSITTTISKKISDAVGSDDWKKLITAYETDHFNPAYSITSFDFQLIGTDPTVHEIGQFNPEGVTVTFKFFRRDDDVAIHSQQVEVSSVTQARQLQQIDITKGGSKSVLEDVAKVEVSFSSWVHNGAYTRSNYYVCLADFQLHGSFKEATEEFNGLLYDYDFEHDQEHWSGNDLAVWQQDTEINSTFDFNPNTNYPVSLLFLDHRENTNAHMRSRYYINKWFNRTELEGKKIVLEIYHYGKKSYPTNFSYVGIESYNADLNHRERYQIFDVVTDGLEPKQKHLIKCIRTDDKEHYVMQEGRNRYEIDINSVNIPGDNFENFRIVFVQDSSYYDRTETVMYDFIHYFAIV